MVTTPLVVALPTLLGVSVKVTEPPGLNVVPACVLSMVRSGTVTVMESVSVLLVVLVSPPPLTAVLLTSTPVVEAPMVATSVMGCVPVPPAAMCVNAPVDVQVSVPSTQVHGAPPLIEVAVRPAGSVSVMVTTPLVMALPTLLGVSVKVTEPPGLNVVPACVLSMVRSGSGV